ncbi:hypothetical protein RZO50_11220 [Microbacterium sp. SSW1-59]|uniref:hypothetical protein n=1 Tax=Microbacterium xanthum TaxID=3079794 RepID=UPI002AD55E36|nr:hypothetical protein [Microbacterium sp. SSW1-59]MDZ8202087.1 hypothetical protein [Microbacterium sp. SSW1-59]
MSAQVGTWRRHKCSQNHREYHAWIKCKIGARRVLWVQGSGPYATISWCGAANDVSVTLHGNAADALAALKQINRLGCCGRCTGNHQVVEVVL